MSDDGGDPIATPQLHFRLRPRQLRRTLLAAVAILVIASFTAQTVLDAAPELPMIGLLARVLYLDAEQSIPTAVSFVLLLSCAGLLGLVAILRDRLGLDRRRYWAALAVLFLALAFDEYLAVHETAADPVRGVIGGDGGGLLHFAWVVPGLVFVAVVGAIFFRFVLSLPPPTRNAFLVAGLAYVAGALVMEMVGGAYVAENGHENTTYLAINSLEEGLEMVGAAVFLSAIFGYLVDQFGGVGVQLRG